MFDPVSEPFFRLDIPNLTHSLTVLSFTGTEAISRPFAFELEVVIESPDLNPKSLMYRSAWLSFAGTQTGFNGQIQRVGLIDHDSSAHHYRLSLGPRLGCLAHRYNQRIFQDLSAPQIIAKVLKEHGIHANAHRFELNGTYHERLYCAQHDESDLQFVQRLCDEEGIHYHFQHSKLRHVLVFADTQGGFRRGPTCFFETRPRRLKPGKAEPTRHQVDQFNVGSLGDEQPGLRSLERAEGESTSPYLGAGLLLSLTEHPRQEWNHLWLLTEVQHRGQQVQMLDQLLAADVSALPYRNRFKATPWEIGFRPVPPEPRPRMLGVQRAQVMGPVVGQEHCDASGRIWVQFDGGRQGQGAHYANCWVPVSSTLVGEGEHRTRLRVGMDVVVDFVDGDPDLPMVTAYLENPDLAPFANGSVTEPISEVAEQPSLELRLELDSFVSAGQKIEITGGITLMFDNGAQLAFSVGNSSLHVENDHLTLRSQQITLDTQEVTAAVADTVDEPLARVLSTRTQHLLELMQDSHPLILLCRQPSGGSFAHCQLHPCACRTGLLVTQGVCDE
ncbi:contractile injection system protein, VgrG/Pvc8 family [Pseudomonas sp. CCI3.2]|uniref:contractile injection system protein, VgrG/Pvc8 family n=1 Tax=unclassified Pseudomonas TaxID=196821 RepID=UPI002AC8F60A|nr:MULTISPECIES: contractile injection system protein, VgrG/Pvc8 family [unclassified Pseudomonas]MEB0079925.1 contractile injection system protein, VgrG/Pvc8 family [Pseudomonas sp. MH10out]MEB0093365.1 contractile injection system protein, VgrG/Pvc8 family [Pseudomonas sp. CCI4.2]MEB0104593.1 contractile injection system protein, VgrG/Pvc8 family [Pseudomonas sp. CCI3.2]MEB0130520.1 contractile injection system protein, VgrG/Pvc8 family [Pseudomonas sp. CCI2.4]MEB0156832.1 contractile inject